MINLSLEILRSYHTKEPIKIVESDLTELEPDLPYQLEIPDGFTHVDHSKETMMKGIIIFPVFKPVFLLPVQYRHEKNGQVLATYPSYANYIDYKIEYKKGNIMKVNLLKGVRVLKQSDERFLHTILTEEPTPYFFEYNKDKGRWKILNDESIFNDIQESIENAVKSPEIMQIIKEYFEFISTFFKDLSNMRVMNPQKVPNLIEENIQTIKNYYEFQYLSGEIEDYHYSLIEEQIQNMEKFNQDKRFQIENAPNDYKIKDFSTDIVTNFIDFMTKETYWVRSDEIYPNIARLHALKQKSDIPRTTDTNDLLKRALLEYKTKNGKDVKDINDTLFKRFMKSLES